MRVAHVILDEIRSSPREAFGLPMPRDARVLWIARWQTISPITAGWGGCGDANLDSTVYRRDRPQRFRMAQSARLMRALEMLASGVAVTTIALDPGYENVSAFIAMFRRTFGVTPTQ